MINNIKFVIVDVDGVLTDGTIYVDSQGCETKAFSVLDGTGISYLHRVGIKTAIISGRDCNAVIHRAKELGIKDVYQGVKNKIDAYEQLLKKYALRDEEICYIGDDLIDLPILYRVGFSVAVANASPIVKCQSDYVTEARGGYGAVREVAEKILRFQDTWHSSWNDIKNLIYTEKNVSYQNLENEDLSEFGLASNPTMKP